MEETLDVAPELLNQLRLYRTQLGLTHDPVVSRSDLDRVQAELGVALRPDVVAFLAMIGHHPDVVVELTETLRDEGMRRRLVAFALDGDGFHWCVHPERDLVMSYPIGESAPNTLAAVVRRLRVQEAMGRSASIATESTDQSVPRIAPPDPVSVRWVEHPVFGRGRVLRELIDGRASLEVEFGDGRRRRILADRLSMVA